MSEKRSYRSPLITPLSGSGVEGQDPRGLCENGEFPYFDCAVGSVFTATCSPGSGVDTSVCSTGGLHTFAACQTGAVAVTACLTGANQN